MNEPQAAWPRIFRRPNNRYFEISVAAWLVMEHFQQHDSCTAEAGGVILGRHLRDGSAIIADEVTTPQRGDRRSRIRFHRAQRWHQEMIDRAWQMSAGTCTYLGEWHTHPEPIPTPSVVDWADWKRRLSTDQFTEPLFFVIVGTKQTRVWEGMRSGVLTPLVSEER
jgi:integrative and conjugative element protein (TIGR02256 family)